MTEEGSATDLVADYDELLRDGAAPSIDHYCANHPEYPELKGRLRALEKLRSNLDEVLGQSAVTPVSDPGPIPGFVLHGLLGRGGMGSVYLAEQSGLHRRCAVKLIHSSGENAQGRFRREADLAARLNHPGIATVYSYGWVGDRAYLATELIRGFPLRELMRVADRVAPQDPNLWLVEALRNLVEGDAETSGRSESHAPVASMVGLATQIADALAHAHRRGVVHRDIKPGNVVVGFDGTAHLIDFGIAIDVDSTQDERFTRTGTFVGSHGYAAPEQLRGAVEGIRSWTDTYALGATLFEMLTQRTPFDAASFADRLVRIDEPPPFGPRHYNRDVSVALDALVMRSLRPDAAERFHDGEEMADALRQCDLSARRPHLPMSRVAALWPRSASQVLVLCLLASTMWLVGEYRQSGVERLRLDSQIRVSDRLSGRALLDFGVEERADAIGACLRFEPGQSAQASRMVLDVVVKDGHVDRVSEQSAQGLGIRARDCVQAEIQRLSVPGVGFGEAVAFVLEVRPRPPSGQSAVPPLGLNHDP